MELTVNEQEISAIYVSGLRELGLANIDPASVKVTAKSTRGPEGGASAIVSFNFIAEPLSTTATASEVKANDTDEEYKPDIDPISNSADNDSPITGMFGN